MAIEAPLSRHRRNGFVIGIAVCVGLSAWCGYDGYFSKTFKEQHHEWWITNRVAPFILLPGAAVLGAWWYAIRGRKLVAGEKELLIAGGTRIPYDAIEKIDKTHFERKGFFVVTYKQAGGSEKQRKFRDLDYDNLPAILEYLIARIT